MFAGEYYCKLDEKGRFPLPQPFRDQLDADDQGNGGRSIVFLKGQERSLWMYGITRWKEILERTRERLDEDQSRLFMHFVVSDAAESELDKAGRVLIPKKLREYAHIATEEEVTVIGLYDRVEVWTTGEWKQYLTQVEEKYETALSKILNVM